MHSRIKWTACNEMVYTGLSVGCPWYSCNLQKQAYTVSLLKNTLWYYQYSATSAISSFRELGFSIIPYINFAINLPQLSTVPTRIYIWLSKHQESGYLCFYWLASFFNPGLHFIHFASCHHSQFLCWKSRTWLILMAKSSIRILKWLLLKNILPPSLFSFILSNAGNLHNIFF